MQQPSETIVAQARSSLTAARLLRLSKPGPRYTSYPTVPEWKVGFPGVEVEAALRQVAGPVSVYLHIPFCKEQCWFCGCTQVVSGRQSAGDRYLDALEMQIDRLELAAERVPAARIHLGGGTPTWLSGDQMSRLFEMISRRFVPTPDAEISVEADPDVTSDEQVEQLIALGVNRLSLGVQSFDSTVLAAINRPQESGRIHAIMKRCREAGMRGCNVDLIYGLPHQTPERFSSTLDEIVAMGPDRLAIYSYAHVPWIRPHQLKIDGDALPDPHQRMNLYLMALERLSEVGYLAIGMDHFALPGDALAVAQRAGQLHRNFMGYTTLASSDLIGLGVSAITELDGLYAQQQTHLGAWYRAVEQGHPPQYLRGIRLSEDDRSRREVIRRLMCDFRLPIQMAEQFPNALDALRPLEAEGLVVLGDDEVQVTPLGRLLVRNVAMVFDSYLGRTEGQRFSATV